MMKVRVDPLGQPVQIPNTCPEGHRWRPESGYQVGFYTCGCAEALCFCSVLTNMRGQVGHHTFTCVICNGMVIDPPCCR